MDPKISVLIPTYNAEETIGKTLDSLLCQTIQNFEIIILNDGSSDATQDVLEIYKKKSKNIHVYTQNNSGVAATRQILIEKAKGKYLLFCDADDYYDVNTIETVLRIMEQENPDLLIFGYSLVRESGCKSVRRRKISEGYHLKVDCEQHHVNGLTDLYWSALWNKCYKTELVKNKQILQFQDLIEDVIFNVEYMERCKSVYILEKELYNYVQIGESLTRGKKVDSEEKIINAFETFIYLQEALIKTYPALSMQEAKYMYKMFIELCERAKKIDDLDTYSKIINSTFFKEVKGKISIRRYGILAERLIIKIKILMKRILQ